MQFLSIANRVLPGHKRLPMAQIHSSKDCQHIRDETQGPLEQSEGPQGASERPAWHLLAKLGHPSFSGLSAVLGCSSSLINNEANRLNYNLLN